MRINVYKEELTDRVEILEKSPDGHKFYGCRFYLELPVTIPQVAADGQHLGYTQYRGPFMHRPGDDDSAAVTFWHDDKAELARILRKAADQLETT